MTERKGLLDWLRGAPSEVSELRDVLREIDVADNALNAMANQIESMVGSVAGDDRRAIVAAIENAMRNLLRDRQEYVQQLQEAERNNHSDTRPLTAKGAHSVYNGR